ncbi:MAG: hypothetical protein H5U17_08825 [Defluviimonas sp.]|nr:hypothetical protein [Defluviimonas sp.]
MRFGFGTTFTRLGPLGRAIRTLLRRDPAGTVSVQALAAVWHPRLRRETGGGVTVTE